jgi:Flp pilus assembly protein TadG
MLSHYRVLQDFRSEKGSVFVLVAVAAMMLIAATGVAVDMARAQVLQAKIQTALDAAGLAAGATANTINVQTQAQKYFSANFPTGYLSSGTVTVVATISPDNSLVTLSANTTQATTFMKAIGINSVSVAANAQITRANEGMELVLVLDNTGSMTTILPGDDIEKIQALKDSINNPGALLDILYGSGNNTAPNLWVGVVPFTDMVNIGNPPPSAIGNNWMYTSFDNALDYGPTVPTSGSTCPTYGGKSGSHANSGSSTRCYYTPLAAEPTSLTNWGGCVLARVPPYEASDQVPNPSTSATMYEAYDYTLTGTSVTGSGSTTSCSGTNSWMCSKSVSGGTEYVYGVTSSTTGPNLNCVATPIQSMVAEKSTIESEVNAMVAGGSTMINLGVGWGYRMLSPNWTGLWGGEMYATGNSTFPQLPLPYHTALMNKVLILMTDGMNSAPCTTPCSTTGSAYQGQTMPSNSQLDTYTENVCDAMKANGIIIYTIGFGTTDNPDDSGSPTYVDGTLLKYCATQNYSGDTSHYFLATSSVVLTSVFQEIGSALANLRVSQ